jgi:ATP-dependent helicase HrpA
VSEPSVPELRTRLDGLTIRDASRLGRRLKGLRGSDPATIGRIVEQFVAAEALVATRIAAVPTITYPDLPVSERRDEIAKAIMDNQVVVVAGETGSGKTTQLPKICLEATPSRAGSPLARSRSALPTNCTSRSGRPSATPSGSLIRPATARW